MKVGQAISLALVWLVACDRNSKVSSLTQQNPCPGPEYGAARDNNERGLDLMFDSQRRVVVLGEYGVTSAKGESLAVPFVARFTEEGELIDSRSLIRTGAADLSVVKQAPVVTLARNCTQGFYLFRFDGLGATTDTAQINPVSQVTKVRIDEDEDATLLGRLILDVSGQTVIDESNLSLSKQPWAPTYQDVVYRYSKEQSEGRAKERWRRNLLRQDSLYASYQLLIGGGGSPLVSNTLIAGLFSEPTVPFTTKDSQVLSLLNTGQENFQRSVLSTAPFEWRDLVRGADNKLYFIGEGTFTDNDGSRVDLAIAPVNEGPSDGSSDVIEAKQLRATDLDDRLYDAVVDATGAVTALFSNDSQAETSVQPNRAVASFTSLGTRGFLTLLTATDGVLDLRKMIQLQNGDLFVLGHTNGLLSDTTGGKPKGYDLALLRLRADGSIRFARTYPGDSLAPIPVD